LSSRPYQQLQKHDMEKTEEDLSPYSSLSVINLSHTEFCHLSLLDLASQIQKFMHLGFITSAENLRPRWE